MPYFHDGSLFEKSNDKVFTEPHKVGDKVPLSGIYRCTLCGHEMVIDKNETFPPDGSHGLKSEVIDRLRGRHELLGFKWELVAAPKHRSGGVNKIQ
ncbi:hypothetical protein [Acetobacter lambici]|uniref:Transcriptional regulator n=1 Tax=Acetobacter lambici TaxID=1332824 RepID=A0ABT1F051_9PROT|nr:hypothetical protein [Acetobacter lambici]MCP1243064.1 hypothetical protein [Acetobacter lambici]MCP1258572.1 hypothetical protein [Acetobacter lambici]